MLTDRLEFLKSFKNQHLILGQGAFGTVNLWICRHSKEKRAIKQQLLSDDRDAQEWQREELALHTAASSSDPDARHIVRIFASCFTDPIALNSARPTSSRPTSSHTFAARVAYLVMEFCELTLSTALQQLCGKPAPDCLRWSGHLFSGLTFMHSKGIIHRDLKPNNTLLAQNLAGGFDLKIADFGLSRQEATVMTAAVVTLPYRAPEILFSSLTEKAG